MVQYVATCCDCLEWLLINERKKGRKEKMTRMLNDVNMMWKRRKN